MARELYPSFHSATTCWFDQTFGEPNEVQRRGWQSIVNGNHTLIAAPTGSGKTLAAFMAAIDDLVRLREAGKITDQTRVVYVSPLKALGNDVHRNLELPIAGISKLLPGTSNVTTAVRTGDTSSYQRTKMIKKPPNILVTTPEGLYALVTADGGRRMLSTTSTVIVDEIHALAADRRGSHLSLTLERLEELTDQRLQRIGLSATQNPIDRVARFLVGPGRDCNVIDEGHQQEHDIRIHLPPHPIGCVAEPAYWESLYKVLCDQIEDHRCTIVFVNSRRLCERVSHQLSKRLGPEHVGAHHGSLSQELRRHAESRLKSGELKALVATSSLELGIDIGDVDLVLQVGSVKRISTLLQRVGRSNHQVGGIPKARVYPTTVDELVEAKATLRCVEAGELDELTVPSGPLDVLAQQIVAAVVSRDWNGSELFELCRRAYPYRHLSRSKFDSTARLLSEGFRTERGRRGQLVRIDQANDRLSARKSARLTALSSGGTIPDSGDYKVRLSDGTTVGAVAEDFAIHQTRGHVIQLGSNAWRVLEVKGGELLVESAVGESSYMPVWFGEQPPRSIEISRAISEHRERLLSAAEDPPHENHHSIASSDLALISFHEQTRAQLGTLPTLRRIIVERFRDSTENTQFVVHSPHGVRINRAWAITIRHQLTQRHALEIQATATDDGFLISLPGPMDLTAGSLVTLVSASQARELATLAAMGIPMFAIRWRHVASRSLLVPRMRAGRRVPPHIQRTCADELLLAAIPANVVCRPLRVDGREGKAMSVRPPEPIALDSDEHQVAIENHPLLKQTLHDCLHESMDVDGLVKLLTALENGTVTVQFVDSKVPSMPSRCLLAAKPPAYLDNGSMIDRRSRNVSLAPRFQQVDSATLIHPEAVALITDELRPRIRNADELADTMEMAGLLSEREIGSARTWIDELRRSGRIERYRDKSSRSQDTKLWVSRRRRNETREGLLRSRMETSPPGAVETIAESLGWTTTSVRRILKRLERGGELVSGQLIRGCNETLWCDRRVLARLERLTRNRLRREIKPIDRDTCFRFIVERAGLGESNKESGRDGLQRVLESLDGVSLPVWAWDDLVLPARMNDYRTDMLNDLMMSGRFRWARLNVPARTSGTRKLSRTTLITIFRTNHRQLWCCDAQVDNTLSEHAEMVLSVLQQRGALFIDAIRDSVRLPPFRYEQALDELVAAGRVTSDGIEGIRCLLAKPGKENRSRLERMEDANTGRWSVLPIPERLDDPAARDEAIQTAAAVLLRRYGILTREFFIRESLPLRWVELLRVLRRLEARDEIRGGYFVQGLSGEQFASPDVVATLRRFSQNSQERSVITVSGMDPMNLTDCLTEARVPRRPNCYVRL